MMTIFFYREAKGVIEYFKNETNQSFHLRRTTTSDTVLYSMLRRYPGNNWDYIEPVGSARLVFTQGVSEFHVEYAFVGLEPVCSNIMYCRIKILTGSSCEEGEQHAFSEPFYNKDLFSLENPWDTGNNTYLSWKGNAIGEFVMNSGIGYYSYIGHVVVVYSMGGERIACGVLKQWYGAETEVETAEDALVETAEVAVVEAAEDAFVEAAEDALVEAAEDALVETAEDAVVEIAEDEFFTAEDAVE